MSNPSGAWPGGLPDPVQFWRDWYQQTESQWGKALEQNLGTEAYAALIGQTLEAYAGYQKALRDGLNRYLETTGLPSRDDFSRLAAQVVALEAKIDSLDEKLDDLQDRLGGRDRPLEGMRADLRDQERLLAEVRDGLAAREQRIEALLARLEAGDRPPPDAPKQARGS